MRVDSDMSIEIKQLLIKSNIVNKAECEEVDSLEDRHALKEEMLAECRQLIHDILRESRER